MTDTVAVIPLKPLLRAKTRLGFDAATRTRLAHAFATDVVSACQRCAQIGEVRVVGALPVGLEARHIDDPGRGLNAALVAATVGLAARTPVLAVMGDLPCLQEEDLSALLAACAELPEGPGAGSMVADTAGTGTTCVWSLRGRFHPQFGPRSRAHHRAGGLVELSGAGLHRVRRDVDSVADLADALRMGAGAATTAAAAELGLYFGTADH